VARADIQCLDRKGLRFFPLDAPRSKFTIKEAAQMNPIKEAKRRIDRRIKA
jgi:hypothetical protein